jgi:hypothetical protein
VLRRPERVGPVADPAASEVATEQGAELVEAVCFVVCGVIGELGMVSKTSRSRAVTSDTHQGIALP